MTPDDVTASGHASAQDQLRYLEVDGVDEDQDSGGVQRPLWQRVLDQVLRLVGDPVVDGEPGLLWVLLQRRLRVITGTCGVMIRARLADGVTSP